MPSRSRHTEDFIDEPVDEEGEEASTSFDARRRECVVDDLVAENPDELEMFQKFEFADNAADRRVRFRRAGGARREIECHRAGFRAQVARAAEDRVVQMQPHRQRERDTFLRSAGWPG